MVRPFLITLFFGLAAVFCKAGDVPRSHFTLSPSDHEPSTAYIWKARPVENSAQLLTLFLHTEGGPRGDVPVLSVLRDTLGDTTSENDRLTSIWLLSDSPLTPVKRIFAAMPFFYWRIGETKPTQAPKHVKPLLDLTQPQKPLFFGVTRSLVQWTVLDPATMPLRATSRSYSTNAGDQERLHLEEAISYLRQAPSGNGDSQLSETEIDGVIARLKLRKQLLGGLVADGALSRLGRESGFDEERVRSRNWELLRQLAERTGLFFEPLQIAGTADEYAMLWFSPQANEPAGVSHKASWKLLNLKDPWTDKRLQHWKGLSVSRSVDTSGSLLPAGGEGGRDITLIPLGVYGMNYPRMPLLLADFRDSLHIRRHEMTQRAINELTSGVLGISHFTNWYFYVAADAYDFVVSRHGSAMDQSERLDSYSRFRTALAVDSEMDGDLRSEMKRVINAMAVNPLENSPARDIQVAEMHYQTLQTEAVNGQLAQLLQKQRRQELARFGKTPHQVATETLLHFISYGCGETKPVQSGPAAINALDEERRLEANLAFLERVNDAGTPPEISYDRARLQNTLHSVSSVSPSLMSASVQARVQKVIQGFRTLTTDPILLEDCRLALNRVNRTSPQLTASIRAGAHSLPASGK